MKSTIFHTFDFEAAHQLPLLPPSHKCSRLHGHSYTVELELRGEVDEFGFVIDYDDLDKAWQPLHDRLDHRFLNEVSKALTCPTTEILSRWILMKLLLPANDKKADPIARKVGKLIQAVVVYEGKRSRARACVSDS